MGVLTEGKTFGWQEQKENGAIDYVKDAAVKQLIQNVRVNYKSDRIPMVWGDEVSRNYKQEERRKKTNKHKNKVGIHVGRIG